MALFINLSAVAAVLRTMAKLNISKSETVIAGEFQCSLEKELKAMMILLLKSIFCSAITRLVLNISPFELRTTTTLMLR